MTAEIPPETIKLVTATLDYIEDNADFRGIDGAQLQQFVVCVRSMIAHATETCEWKDEGADVVTSCGQRGYLIHGMWKHCPYCGKRLTETKRPATTGGNEGGGIG